MAAYEPEMWNELFVATAGAMAALAGLIFVAVTLNHEEVLASPGLPPLAARSVGTLLALVVMSTFGLAPGQDAAVLGVELVVLGGVVTVLLVDEPTRYAAVLTAISLVSSLPMALAGLSLLVGWGGGCTGSSPRSSPRWARRCTAPGCCSSRSVDEDVGSQPPGPFPVG